MKWLSKIQISVDPLVRAEQCIHYLNGVGERPEKEVTIEILLETIKEEELTYELYKQIVRIGIQQINFWLAIFGNEDAIEALIGWDAISQEIISNMLRNQNLRPRHHVLIEMRLDNSPKGLLNKKLLESRHDY